ncbi:OsmC family protein [Adhaeribacter aquaticus]|uniref:OsmC family protein n=1 Tax=Adhaeribacter aquaticus TaxID=299567 RepID=UPI000401A2E4|nr:OsmC family protein [Adhaeribacter aquaticus]
MAQKHTYQTTVLWTGNKGTGTVNYQSYDRDYSIFIQNKSAILGSSDPAFRGDKSRHNPEDLLVSSLSACHMLWYLHLCAVNQVVVVDYVDEAIGTMQETTEGSGAFTQVMLQPVVSVAKAEMVAIALELHQEANRMCFIANSVKFPVLHQPIIKIAESSM